MNQICFLKKNTQFKYSNTSYNNINNNISNKTKGLTYISSVKNYNNMSINELNEDKFIYNSKYIPKDVSIKDIKLNKLKNTSFLSCNNIYKYIPFSSRDQQIMKNNFFFHNNKENKTINQTEENNFKENHLNIDKFPLNEITKNNIPTNRIYHKKYERQNYSISTKMAPPYLNEINNINSLSVQCKIYQTPKNVIFSKKNKKIIEPKLNEKTKYRKIFNENILKEDINEKNKTLEKNGYDSYNNIHNRSNNNYIRIDSRDCITPFLVNRFIKKIDNYKIKYSENNLNKKNINTETNIKNDIKNEHKRKMNYINQNNNNFQKDKTVKSQKSIYAKESNKIYFSTNFDELINNNELNTMIHQRKTQAIPNKENILSTNVLLSENFDDIDTKFYSNRCTYYDNRKMQNNLFLSHLENSKRLTNANYNNTDLFQENKENINNNSKYIQDLFLFDDPSNILHFNLDITQKLSKIKNKNNAQIDINNSTFTANNLNKKNVKIKPSIINNSDMSKENYILKNRMKQDEMGNNINIEIKDYKIKETQNISLIKKKLNEISKLKGELNKLNNKVGIKNNNIGTKERKVIKQYNTFIKTKDISNTNINNHKINNKNKIITNSKKITKVKPKQNKDSKNTNFDLFLKGSNLLNDNSQKIYSQQSQTTMSTSNLNRLPSNSYKSKYSNFETISEENKCIYSLYYTINSYNKNENIKISSLCFDPEDASFKTKKIKDINFNKKFYESINKANNVNKSIYLIKKEDYYIVTGANYNKFYKYTFKDNKIEQKCDLKYNHSNGGMISYNEQIICLSGNNNKKVEVFSESNNTWIELPEMQIERSFFSSCIIKNRYIFIFFGYNYGNNKYLDSIEFFDILKYNMNIINQNSQKVNNVYWRYINYNYFGSNPSHININLIGAVAINYSNEKIILLGGKNCLNKENNNGYYQFIFDENDLEGNEINSYFERIVVKDMKNCFFNFDYKYLEELKRNNIMNEQSFVAFDNNYNVHLIKLSTMNEEIFHFNK